MAPLFRPFLAMLLAFTLTGVRASATDATFSSDSARKPPAPHLTVSARVKTLVFRWARVRDVQYYMLMSNPDGHSGFVPVGSSIPARTTHKAIGVPVHLLDWDNATYFLSACNKHGCSHSNLVSIAELQGKAVGTIDPPRPRARFSDEMTMSGDGNVLAVSDPHNPAGEDADFAGAVFVYRKFHGQWRLEAKLQQPDPQLSDEFGSAIAISADGRTLAIGADQSGTPRMGTVYLFAYRNDAWVKVAQLSPSPAQLPSFGGVLFGAALDLNGAGTLLAVGAPFEPLVVDGKVLERAGAVYVFRLDSCSGQWCLGKRVTTPTPEGDDRFGSGLTLSGNGRRLVALAGEQNDVTETPEEGYVDRINTLHAFSEEGSNWQHEAAIEAPPGSTFFGGSGHDPAQLIHDRALDIDFRGDLFAVGVGRIFEQPHRGEVRIYERVDRSWKLTNRLIPPPGREGFGDVLALSGTGEVLAARALETAGEPTISVVVLTRSQQMWVERSVLTSPEPPQSLHQSFARSLALSNGGRTLAVGAVDVDDGHIFMY